MLKKDFHHISIAAFVRLNTDVGQEGLLVIPDLIHPKGVISLRTGLWAGYRVFMELVL